MGALNLRRRRVGTVPSSGCQGRSSPLCFPRGFRFPTSHVALGHRAPTKLRAHLPGALNHTVSAPKQPNAVDLTLSDS